MVGMSAAERLTGGFFSGIHAGQKIQLVEEAVYGDVGNLAEIEQTTSEKAPDDGYVANEAVVKCFDAMKYHYTGGRYINTPVYFRLFSPATLEPGKKYPLVVWLHGTGESDDDNKRQLSHMQSMIRDLSGARRLNIFILATQCPKDNRDWLHSMSHEGKGDAPLTITKEILDVLINEYPIDEKAVSLFGICSGASAAWDWALKTPERFVSIGVCSAQPPGQSNLFSLKDTKIWIFNNIDDAGSPIKPIREFMPKLEVAGVDSFLTEGIGSHNSWSKALLDQKAISWMALQRKGEWSPPPGVLVHDTYFARPGWGQQFWMFWLPGMLIVVTVLYRITLFFRKIP